MERLELVVLQDQVVVVEPQAHQVVREQMVHQELVVRQGHLEVRELVERLELVVLQVLVDLQEVVEHLELVVLQDQVVVQARVERLELVVLQDQVVVQARVDLQERLSQFLGQLIPSPNLLAPQLLEIVYLLTTEQMELLEPQTIHREQM